MKKCKKTVYHSDKFKIRDKIIIHFVIFAILVVLIGKSFFIEFDYFILYVYGVSVTLVLFINFYYAIFKYQDPAVLAKSIKKEYSKNEKRPLVTCMVAVYNEEKDVEQCILSLVR